MTLAISAGMWTAIGLAIVYFLIGTVLMFSLGRAADRGDRLLSRARERGRLAAGGPSRAPESRQEREQ